MKDDGGPTFSRASSNVYLADGKYAVDKGNSGMTLRDYFAAKAMAAMLTGVVGRIGPAKDVHAYAAGACNAVIANRAYVLADVMIMERKK